MKYLWICLIFVFISCKQESNSPEELITKEEADQFLENWHRAIANKDSAAVFSVLADDFHYFGTDSFENWNKQAFQDFALPLFRQGKSWDFKVTHAEYFINSKSIWTYQMLDTWMGPCRGTALISKNTRGSLQLHFYHLSFTIPNDDMGSVINLIQSK